MAWLGEMARRLRVFLRGSRFHRELDQEMRLHRELREREFASAGATDRRAQYASAQKFGNTLELRERSRGLWGVALMDELLQDLRFGLRMLGRNPGFSAVAILTLALGIGANTALFSVIDAVILRTLPVRHPEQLVALSDPEAGGVMQGLQDGRRSLFSFHEFEGLRDNDASLGGIFAMSSTNFVIPLAVAENDTGSPAQISMVSGAYFEVLGAEPQIGHALSPAVDRGRGDAPQAVLSYRFWQRRMAEDPAAIGKKIRIRQTLFDVIGVMPPTFTGVSVGDAPDMWVPITMQQALLPGRDWLSQPPGSIRRTLFLHIMGRLKPGVTMPQANSSLNATFHNILQIDGSSIADPGRRKILEGGTLQVQDARRGVSSLRGEYSQPLYVLMGLVALLLLLACTNVANLLSARASGRRRELAMRVALGSGSSRLIRQMLTESLLLSVIGAAIGLSIAKWGVRVLVQLVSGTSQEVSLDVHLDVRVLLFTIGITLATGLLFGLVPAVKASRVDFHAELRGTGKTVGGNDRASARIPMGKVFVGLQVAVSLLLLVTAGLFVRSLQKLTAVPLGYEADHLVLFRMNPVLDGYKPAEIPSLFTGMLERFSSIPGVRGASFSDNGLFFGGDSGDDITIVGSTPKAGAEMGVRLDNVGPNYFATIGIPVIAGRDASAEDTKGTHHMWLNETMAKYYFGGDSPLGRHIIVHYSIGDTEYDVVGVVGDAKYDSLRDETPRRAYLSDLDSMFPLTSANFEVRCGGDCASPIGAIRGVIRESGASLTIPQFVPLHTLIDEGLLRDRLTARLSTFFGSLALVLACIGLYGVLSYNLARRVGEMGVRMALGASPGSILRLVLGDALIVTGIGAAVGLVVALAAARVLGAMLFGVTSHDPATLAGAAAVLFGVAAIAAFLPAWRASRVDPMTALRDE
ncbi:MAG TPA: ABC transporter permease [Candidatus Acidoferrales bacterium]|nr:ABC transporter permease [Candidatus Acidoferrales bacterium]